MKEGKQKLTLGRPVTYQIKVPGELDERWSDWIGGMTIAVESEGDGLPVTILTGNLDQASIVLIMIDDHLIVFVDARLLPFRHD